MGFAPNAQLSSQVWNSPALAVHSDPTTGAPSVRQPNIFLPQLGFAPPALPNAAGYDPRYGPTGAPPNVLPYLAGMQRQNVLGPLMQPNYGLGVVSPFEGAQFSGMQMPMSGAPNVPGLGGGLGGSMGGGMVHPGFANQRFGNVKLGYGSMR